MASDVAGSVRRQASELNRQASELGDQARRGVREASTGFWDTLEEQPLVIGAANKGLGQEALESGKQIASAAAETLKQAPKSTD